MATEFRKKIWKEFCVKHRVIEDGVPLFDGDPVQVLPLGRGGLSVLSRSQEMDELVLREAGKVILDYNDEKDSYEGLIYMMYREVEGAVHPLYIGKTEKYGRTGNLSANLDGIKAGTQHFFARWGYSYDYHMGGLSAVVLGHPEKHQTTKYEEWAQALFRTPFSKRRLTRQVSFWTMAWPTGTVGPWAEIGPTSLTFLEYLLIGIASFQFPDLLNREGVNREGLNRKGQQLHLP